MTTSTWKRKTRLKTDLKPLRIEIRRCCGAKSCQATTCGTIVRLIELQFMSQFINVAETKEQTWQIPQAAMALKTFRFSKASKQSASVRACTLARRVRADCTTSFTKWWTTPSTRRSPASAPRSQSPFIPTIQSRSSTTAAAFLLRSTRRKKSRLSRLFSPSCMPAASSAVPATRCRAACTASACPL